MSDFADVVKSEVIEPLKVVCKVLADDQNNEAFAFFSNLLYQLDDPTDEALVLVTVIELSKCAFLGFYFSPGAQAAINNLLDRSIEMSHTMSAGNEAH